MKPNSEIGKFRIPDNPRSIGGRSVSGVLMRSLNRSAFYEVRKKERGKRGKRKKQKQKGEGEEEKSSRREGKHMNEEKYREDKRREEKRNQQKEKKEKAKAEAVEYLYLLPFSGIGYPIQRIRRGSRRSDHLPQASSDSESKQKEQERKIKMRETVR